MTGNEVTPNYYDKAVFLRVAASSKCATNKSVRIWSCR